MSKRRSETLCPSCCDPPVNFLCIASSCTKRVRFKATARCESLVYWLATLWGFTQEARGNDLIDHHATEEATD